MSPNDLRLSLEKCRRAEHTCYICRETISIPATFVQSDAQRSISECVCRSTNMCVPCVREMIKHNRDSRQATKCPTCRSHVSGYVKNLSMLIALDVMHPFMRCYKSANGCVWEGTRGQFEVDHLTTCDYINCSCKHREKGCQFYGMRKDVVAHEAICFHNVVVCADCRVSHHVNAFVAHQSICPERSVNCKYCDVPHKRKDEWTHYQFANCIRLIADRWISDNA
jgi:hypothetical protein